MSIRASAARGALAGLVGGSVMSAFQKTVEMPLTRRGESFFPAQLATKLLRLDPARARDPRVNWAAHVANGVGWGAGHGVIAQLTELRGQRSVAVAFAVLYSGDVALNAALGLYRPREWSTQDVVVDVVDKLVHAEATAVVFDLMRSDAGAR